MSNPGERDDAPEVDEVEDVADEEAEGGEGQSDGAGSDSDTDDEGDGDEGSGAEDSGSEDDAGRDEGKAGQPDEVKGPGRRERAVIEAKRVAKEAKAEAEATRAELQRLQNERNNRSIEEQRALRAARLETMSPEERADFLVNEARQETQSAIAQLRFEQADGRDQTKFESLCARKPHFAAIADEVERELVNMRRNGATAPRETVALYLIGKKADERASKGGKAKQAAKGAARVQRERVAAPGGRSDVRGGNERRGAANEAEARRQRLEGKLL